MVLGGQNYPLSLQKQTNKKGKREKKADLQCPWFNELFRLIKSFGAHVVG